MLLSVKQLLPQSGPMCLIDRVLTQDGDDISCELSIRADNLFYDESIAGIPSWVGVEFMAQTVACYAGLQQAASTLKLGPSIGLLLSVRQFTSEVNYFKLHERLLITAHKTYLENDVGVFTCRICRQDGDQLITMAHARLNTIQPSQEKLQDILGQS